MAVVGRGLRPVARRHAPHATLERSRRHAPRASCAAASPAKADHSCARPTPTRSSPRSSSCWSASRARSTTTRAATAAPSERALVQELERLKEALRDGAKTEDQPALLEQWHRQSALLEQLRTLARAAAGRPRLALLRAPAPARERRRAATSCSARRTRLERGVAIVDWRHAPVSRIFYRYQQGDEYEEEIAGPRAQRRGRGAAHASRSATGALAARSTRPRASSSRRRAPRRLAPRRSASRRGSPAAKARALRAHAVGDGPAAPPRHRPRRASAAAPTSTCPTSPGSSTRSSSS